MRSLTSGMLILAIVVLSACGATGIPSSSLVFRDGITNALLSASEAQGTITLNAGDTRQVKIVHTYTKDGGNTESNDVTQFVDFAWETGTGATIDALGNISGVSAGVSILRAKYRPDWLGDSDYCRLTVVVN